MSTRETELAVELQGLLTALVRAVVKSPERVSVVPSVHGGGTLIALLIQTDPEDIRRVIGKAGKHIKAIQVIMAELGKVAGCEVTATVDDRPNQQGFTPEQRKFKMGEYDASRFRGTIDILRRIVLAFLEVPHVLKISTTELGQTAIIDVTIKDSDFPTLYGKEVEFRSDIDGTPIKDGHILGAIRNIFDGISKNHGRIVKITITKV